LSPQNLGPPRARRRALLPAAKNRIISLERASAFLEELPAQGCANSPRSQLLTPRPRRAIREQLESAHGRLRDLYKARPAVAEEFFLKEGSRRPAKKTS